MIPQDLPILAIETTGKTGSVAALLGQECLLQQELNAQQRSAQSLAPGIKRLLAEVSWRPSDVRLIAVTAGPGSFTGLRVGVTTAKTMAYALGADVLGINSLRAIAQRITRPVERLTVLMDAYRGQLFTATYDCREADQVGASLPREMEPARIVDLDVFLGALPQGAVLSGPALSRIGSQLPPGVDTVEEALWQPTAVAVGQIAAVRYGEGHRDDLWQLVPRYFRPSAAEEKWAAQGK